MVIAFNQSFLTVHFSRFTVIPAKAGIQPRIKPRVKHGAFLAKAEKSGFPRIKCGAGYVYLGFLFTQDIEVFLT